ncbi:hypothetical protein [Nonomuraea sp. B1E8]|uniref:hypothetical protein n=1 Tax=unclassified Nonomuraea TaxID=2593643 RepID=UPI00325E8CC4
MVAMIVAATGGLVACRSNGSLPEPLSSAASPLTTTLTPTPSPTTDQDAVLTVYRELYRAGPRAEQAPPEERRAILEPIVTQSLLTTMVKGIAKLRARGRMTYGYPILHPYDVQIRGDRAVLHDCQDGTNGGHADHRTGKRLTHGMPGTHMVAALAKEADGVWRVAKVDQVDEPCSPAP